MNNHDREHLSILLDNQRINEANWAARRISHECYLSRRADVAQAIAEVRRGRLVAAAARATELFSEDELEQHARENRVLEGN